MKTKFNVISPDGFTIYYDKQYNTKEEAEIALDEWVKNYETQGYYSTKNRDKIDYSDIKLYCTIIEENKYLGDHENWLISELEDWKFTFTDTEDSGFENIEKLIQKVETNECTIEDYNEILFHLWQKNGQNN